MRGYVNFSSRDWRIMGVESGSNFPLRRLRIAMRSRVASSITFNACFRSCAVIGVVLIGNSVTIRRDTGLASLVQVPGFKYRYALWLQGETWPWVESHFTDLSSERNLVLKQTFHNYTLRYLSHAECRSQTQATAFG